MARLTRPAADQQQGDNKPSWPQFIDKWFHNPLILSALLTAFLALLTALVLIAGLAGAGLWAFIAAAAFPATKTLRSRATTLEPDHERNAFIAGADADESDASHQPTTTQATHTPPTDSPSDGQ